MTLSNPDARGDDDLACPSTDMCNLFHLNPKTKRVDIEAWWMSTLQLTHQEQRRHVAALLMYTAWNIWKERNRRVFEGRSMTAPLIFGSILEELGLRQAALRA